MAFVRSFIKKRQFAQLMQLDESELNNVAEFAVMRIRSATIQGKSLATGQKFKPLAKSTITTRFRAQKKGTSLSEFFIPRKSHLTFTGQMIAALTAMINTRKQTITVDVDNTPRKGSYLTNQDVARHVEERGRPFIGLDEAGKKRVTNMVKAVMRRKLRGARSKNI
jgi:hypothetical protein